MDYKCNPKHKEPFQPGRKGSLCPKSVKQEKAQELLDQSVEEGGHRYATLEGRAYKAIGDKGIFHGFPIGFREVPQKVLNAWKREGKITRKQIRDGWDGI